MRDAPLSTPPRFETAIAQVGGTPEPAPEVMRSKVVGETRTFRDSCSAPSQNPAIPRRGRIRSTTSSLRSPKARTAILAPGLSASARARSLLIAACPSAGVGPAMPVAAASPPKRRAASKSTPSTCARGAERRRGPVVVTAPSIHESARMPSMSPSSRASGR